MLMENVPERENLISVVILIFHRRKDEDLVSVSFSCNHISGLLSNGILIHMLNCHFIYPTTSTIVHLLFLLTRHNDRGGTLL